MNDVRNRLMTLVAKGQYDKARRECLKACKQQPTNAEMWYLLSAICGQQGDYTAAERYCLKVIEINPSVAEVYYNLAIAQRGLGKRNEALVSLKKDNKHKKDLPVAYLELGNISLEMGDCHAALRNYKKAELLAAGSYQVHTGMAFAFRCAGETDKAVSAAKKSLSVNDAQPDLLVLIAKIYDEEGKKEQALHFYLSAADKGYAGTDIYVNIARMYTALDNKKEAISYYSKALEYDENYVEALVNLSLLYESTKKLDLALNLIERAYALDSENIKIMFNFATILSSVGQFCRAESIYRRILEIDPDCHEAALNLGNLCLLSGKNDEATSLYRSACISKKCFFNACSNYLLSLNYTDDRTNEYIFEEHKVWGGRIEAEVRDERINVVNRKQDGDRIKVGYISPDLRNHSVAYFFESILENTNSEIIHTYCYSDVKDKDEVTLRFEKLAETWVDSANMRDDELAKQIAHDEIDVLVDLCGHAAGNRLPVFAMRPAPVQVSYLGYPNTTGLESMDYRIVDGITDPVNYDGMLTEERIYINPSFLVYSPSKDAPSVSVLPALTNGYITFGSFNNLAKVTSGVIDVWANIIRSVPNARLMIKARQYADPELRKVHLERFSDCGIGVDRIELVSYSPTTEEHLSMYRHVDIALDTFPYNGTTTTFEALWMGVPVVSLCGYAHASRVGASVLTNIEMPELIADTEDQYITAAIRLSSDLGKLASIRSTLRQRMSNSALMDGKAFCEKYEKELIRIARRSC